MKDSPKFVTRNLQNNAAQTEQHMFNRLKRNDKRKADAVNDIMCGLRIETVSRSAWMI